MQTRQEDAGHRVDAGWWAWGHQERSTDPTLLCPGWLCVPLDAWSVVVTSVFRMVQNLRSTDRTFGSIFGVSTRVCAPDQSACFVSYRMTLGGVGYS